MDVAVQAVLFLVVIGCLAVIVSRAGYPWWYSLALLIPVLNLLALVRFAFGPWPHEDRADRYRPREADDDLRDPGYLIKRRVKKAVALEREGRVEEAVRLYERIAAGGQAGNAELARAAIARLRTPPGLAGAEPAAP